MNIVGEVSVLTLPMVMVAVLVIPQRTVSWYTDDGTVLTATFIPDQTQRICGSHCTQKPLTQQHGIEAYRLLRGICHIST